MRFLVSFVANVSTYCMDKIAALFVSRRGPYWNDPRFHCWDEVRDARKYAGPYRIIAHPPCERWGNFSTGNWPGKSPRAITGDDGGCFEAALSAVWRYGGVIEHPAGSKAWRKFGLPLPGKKGTWSGLDTHDGRSVSLTQASYGHLCTKPTWLYAVNCPAVPVRSRIKGAYSIVRTKVRTNYTQKELPKSQRHVTPIPFVDFLVSMVGVNGYA